MNATVYVLIEDNKTLQFSCPVAGDLTCSVRANVDPGLQSAQRGWTQDTNSLMSHTYIPATTLPGGEQNDNTRVHTLKLTCTVRRNKTHIVEIYFVGGEGKLHCWACSLLSSAFASIFISDFLWYSHSNIDIIHFVLVAPQCPDILTFVGKLYGCKRYTFYHAEAQKAFIFRSLVFSEDFFFLVSQL